MPINRKVIIKHIFLPIGFGIVIGCLLTLIFSWQDFFSWQAMLKQSIYSVILTLLLWKGNEAIAEYLSKTIDWLEKTKKRVIIHLTLAFVYSIVVILLFYCYLWFIVMHKQNFKGFYEKFNASIYICFSLNLIVLLSFYSYNFFLNWKESLLNEERLKRESLALQYESLKNQVNPHFLFNSLNVLTSLIEHDREASIKYVKQLSDVFRYVLDQNVKEQVPLETELKFIDSYIFLQKIRFGKNFKISITIKEYDFLIVPLALQILIENAVKHNEISAENPLMIHIYDEEMYLVVDNNLQPRNYLPDSNMVGLKTLEFQYEFLSGKKVEVICQDNHFVVKLPKLKNMYHASTGN